MSSMFRLCVPQRLWVETKEEKDKLLNDYRAALGAKDCKYFKKGEGKCPFGNKCFYKHALPNGDIVDVGLPKRARKLHSQNQLIDLLDVSIPFASCFAYFFNMFALKIKKKMFLWFQDERPLLK